MKRTERNRRLQRERRNPVNNPRGNAISKLAYKIAGNARLFYERDKEERLAIRETAAQLYDLGADFVSAAQAEQTERRGFVYVIVNPAWPGFVKIGRAFDPVSRVRGYQTGSPHRDYEVYDAVYFHDCYLAEREIHARLEHWKHDAEWFAIHPDHAMHAIHKLQETL